MRHLRSGSHGRWIPYAAAIPGALACGESRTQAPSPPNSSAHVVATAPRALAGPSVVAYDLPAGFVETGRRVLQGRRTTHGCAFRDQVFVPLGSSGEREVALYYRPQSCTEILAMELLPAGGATAFVPTVFARAAARWSSPTAPWFGRSANSTGVIPGALPPHSQSAAATSAHQIIRYTYRGALLAQDENWTQFRYTAEPDCVYQATTTHVERWALRIAGTTIHVSDSNPGPRAQGPTFAGNDKSCGPSSGMAVNTASSYDVNGACEHPVQITMPMNGITLGFNRLGVLGYYFETRYDSDFRDQCPLANAYVQAIVTRVPNEVGPPS